MGVGFGGGHEPEIRRDPSERTDSWSIRCTALDGSQGSPPGNVVRFENLANPYDSQPRAGCYGLRRLAMTCEGRCREPMPIASDSPFRITLFFCSRSCPALDVSREVSTDIHLESAAGVERSQDQLDQQEPQ